MAASVHISRVGVRAALAVVLVGCLISSAFAAAPEGGFLAVANDSRNNGDSKVSITFFDVDDLTHPLFSVYTGDEFGSSNNWEETQALTVDPATGDVYWNAFDSAGSGAGTIDDWGDTQGDLDLYKISFATVYDHWSTNFEGMDVRTLPNPDGWGPSPTVPNDANLDYVTYSNRDDFDFLHSNQYVLSGVVNKIGEVIRGNSADPGPFYPYNLDFIDADTLVMIDDSVGTSALDDAADDHGYRIIRRVATTNGSATTSAGALPTTTAYLDGGYNGGTGAVNSFGKPTESWESELIQLMNLETVGHSEPESIAYYNNGAGVQGFWVTERDMPANGDTIAFMEIDSMGNAVGYRPMIKDDSPFILRMDDTPSGDPDLYTDFPRDGKLDTIFVDKDNGDLIIVESGSNDTLDGIGTDHEPAVIRLSVSTYDDGSGNIDFDAWGSKIVLAPTKDTGDGFLERGYWSDFDSANNIVYFFAPGGGAPETPEFQMDIYALDLDTGMTTSYLNVDDSVSLFLTDPYGDKVVFFSLEAGLPGDFNGDGYVDNRDYTVWRDHEGEGDESALNGNGDGIGGVDEDDFDLWRMNWGAGTPPGSGSGSVAGGGSAVPEPASLVLLASGLIGLGLARRGKRR